MVCHASQITYPLFYSYSIQIILPTQFFIVIDYRIQVFLVLLPFGSMEKMCNNLIHLSGMKDLHGFADFRDLLYLSINDKQNAME